MKAPNEAMTTQPMLLDVPQAERGPSLTDKIEAFKKLHGIQTHSNRDRGDPGRWVAVKIPPHRLDNGKPLDGMELFDMFAWFGRLLDEGGWTGYGPSQLAAIRDLCKERGIDCNL